MSEEQNRVSSLVVEVPIEVKNERFSQKNKAEKSVV